MLFPFFRKKVIVEEIQPQACPSFDDEPWKSKADRLRPTSLDKFILADVNDPIRKHYKPLPTGHRYVKLVLRFLDTVPDECWIDEDNEVD